MKIPIKQKLNALGNQIQILTKRKPKCNGKLNDGQMRKEMAQDRPRFCYTFTRETASCKQELGTFFTKLRTICREFVPRCTAEFQIN